MLKLISAILLVGFVAAGVLRACGVSYSLSAAIGGGIAVAAIALLVGMLVLSGDR